MSGSDVGHGRGKMRRARSRRASAAVLSVIVVAMILDVPPMSQFDAVATPMSAAFSSTPNLRPYTAVVPGISLFAKNTFESPMATTSLRIDFSNPDLILMRLMNRILWKAMRGADSRMPSPVHSIESVRAGDS
jgi:hypothetical protein